MYGGKKVNKLEEGEKKHFVRWRKWMGTAVLSVLDS